MTNNNIAILHIASDEKFINAAYYIFEKAFPGCNRFLIPHSRFNRNLKYVKVDRGIEIVNYKNGLVNYFSDITRKYDCVFLHGITEFNSSVFLSASEKNKFVGILWGAELYTEENFSERSLKGEFTSKIRLPKPDQTPGERVKELLRDVIYGRSNIFKDATIKAAHELPYLAVPYREEFDLFRKRKLISAECCMIPFTYYPLEFIMKGNELSVINGNDILVGNSASYTNNHLEAFHKLKKIHPGKRKIIVPLSYGDRLYADFIESEGMSMFKENVVSLRKFMPLDEYTKQIMSCGIVVMHQFRQQAVGNILSMLWLGSKVYLSEHNTFLHYLKRIGIIIFSIEKDLITENEVALTNLSKKEIEQNKAILGKIFGEDYIISELKNAVLKNFQKANIEIPE